MAALPSNSRCRWKILKELHRRNEDEKSFAAIVLLSNTLFDTVDFLKKENLRLKVQNANLEQQNFDLRLHGETSSPKTTEQMLLLEKKMFQLQEELTELHRKKGEFAQQIIDLRNTLDEKDKIYASKCLELQEAKAALLMSEEACRNYQQKISEAELNLQLIRDEYDTLLLTYSSLEEKKQKLEKEHQDLISCWMSFKARDADKLNAETEKIQQNKQEKLKKALEEAAREPVTLDMSRVKSAICIDAAISVKLAHKFEAHDGEVNAAVWAPSGNKLVTGGGDRKIKMWEVPLAQPILRGVAHESNSSVMSVDFDSEENFVLGSSCDFASRVWTANDLKIKHTLTGHSGKVMSAKFLGESSKVVSGSHDRTLKIWDLRRRACVRTILAGSGCNDVITCCASGNIISGHFDKRIRFWDMRTDSSKNELLLQGKITSLDISHNEYLLLSCARDDTLKLIDLRMNSVIRTFSADGFVVGCDWARARFSPDSRYCVAGSHDGSVFIWSLDSGKVEKILKEHNCTVITCCWSPSGRLLVSCDRNKRAILWSDI